MCTNVVAREAGNDVSESSEVATPESGLVKTMGHPLPRRATTPQGLGLAISERTWDLLIASGAIF